MVSPGDIGQYLETEAGLLGCHTGGGDRATADHPTTHGVVPTAENYLTEMSAALKLRNSDIFLSIRLHFNVH